MKVTVNEKPTVEEKPFPKLMQNNVTRSIIIATGKGIEGYTGTLIKKAIEFDVGCVREDWCEENFQDFEGEVTLSND